MSIVTVPGKPGVLRDTVTGDLYIQTALSVRAVTLTLQPGIRVLVSVDDPDGKLGITYVMAADDDAPLGAVTVQQDGMELLSVSTAFLCDSRRAFFSFPTYALLLRQIEVVEQLTKRAAEGDATAAAMLRRTCDDLVRFHIEVLRARDVSPFHLLRTITATHAKPAEFLYTAEDAPGARPMKLLLVGLEERPFCPREDR